MIPLSQHNIKSINVVPYPKQGVTIDPTAYYIKLGILNSLVTAAVSTATIFSRFLLKKNFLLRRLKLFQVQRKL
jgi:hypothetical protein